jgi:hypothetical protein
MMACSEKIFKCPSWCFFHFFFWRNSIPLTAVDHLHPYPALMIYILSAVVAW